MDIKELQKKVIEFREEVMRISQIVTSIRIKYSKRVHAFTEQGVAMLSRVLNSDRAIHVKAVHQKQLLSVLPTYRTDGGIN